jgi:hypothetical protein
MTLTARGQRSLDRYAQAAKAVGVPADQIRNFLRAGIVLQPKQLAASAAARECDKPDGPVEVAYGGARMGGKSHWMLSQLGADDCVRYPGLKCLMLRKVGSSGKESFEDLLPKTILRLGEYIPSQSLFAFPNGSRIKLGNFKDEKDVDKYLGLEYGAIGIEEDTTLSSSKRRAVRSCCRSPKGSGWRARTYSTTNPGGVGHAAYKARFIEPFRKGCQTETRFIPATIDDNSFVASEYRAFLDGLTGWLKKAWRYGDWDAAAGQYFTTYRREIHTKPPEQIEILPNWRVWASLDYGFTHYTVVHLFAQDGDGTVYVFGEHAERRWLVERHARAINAMLERHGIKRERLRRFVAGRDCFAKTHTGGTIADDYKAHGFLLKRANDDRVTGAAEFLRRLGDVEADPPIAPRLVISEACPRLIECLPSLEHDPVRPEDVDKVDCDDDGLGGDDAYDSARYGLMVAANRKIIKRFTA